MEDPNVLADGVAQWSVDRLDAAEFDRLCAELLGAPATLEAHPTRTRLSERVWVTTHTPADGDIAPHHEGAHQLTWPGRILYGCAAPDQRGEVLLTDAQAVLANLPEALVEEFYERDWMLLRNARPGLGTTWQDLFGCSSMDQLHHYCRTQDIDVQWVGDSALRTRQVRRAAARHPGNGALLWFNQIAPWHASALPPGERQRLLEECGEEGLPRATFYGDGGTIPDAVIAEIREVCQRHTIAIPWRSGQLLLLDNMRFAHAHRPGTGSRTLLLGVGSEVDRWAATSLDALRHRSPTR